MFQSWEPEAELQRLQLKHENNPSAVASLKVISWSETETDSLGAQI